MWHKFQITTPIGSQEDRFIQIEENFAVHED